jgi:hypothetical protein
MRMSDHFPASDIDIVAPDGTVRCSTRGVVADNSILIEDASITVEPGDEIRRKVPNGREEVFTVHDPRFYPAWQGFADHYQIKVSRKGAYPKGTGGYYSINVSGNNARVNIGSVDQSKNIVSEQAVFGNLRSAIQGALTNNDERRELLACVDAMETAQGRESFIAKYQRFMDLAATHVSVIAPFLPALTKLLG